MKVELLGMIQVATGCVSGWAFREISSTTTNYLPSCPWGFAILAKASPETYLLAPNVRSYGMIE